jgi:hypothetical protein
LFGDTAIDQLIVVLRGCGRTIWTYTFNKVVDVITELRRKLATPGSRGL